MFDFWLPPGKKKEKPCLSADVKPIKPARTKSRFFGEVGNCCRPVLNSLGIRPFLSGIILGSLDKTRREQRLGFHAQANLFETSPDLRCGAVRENRLRDNEIEFCSELRTRESVLIKKTWILHRHQLGPQLPSDAFLDEPLLRLDPEVMIRQQVHDEELSGSKRSATDIQQAMPLP